MTFQKYTSYAFTLPGEFKKNITLEPDEKIIFQEKIKFHHFLTAWLGFFTLTNKRIIVIKHYAFWKDTVISIDFKDIQGAQFIKNYIDISYQFNNEIKNLKFFLFSGFTRWQHNVHGTKELFELILRCGKTDLQTEIKG